MSAYLGELRWRVACGLLKVVFRIAPDGTAREKLAQYICGWADECLAENSRREAERQARFWHPRNRHT